MKETESEIMNIFKEERFISKEELSSFFIEKNALKDHNYYYLIKKIIDEKKYLDNILSDIDKKIKLDLEQKIAVVMDAKYQMIIAGAGSGKTTTMAAKVKYLVEKRNINPKEILVISYTNKAVDELKERINKKLKINTPIMTFHKLGLNLIDKKTRIETELETIIITYYEQNEEKVNGILNFQKKNYKENNLDIIKKSKFHTMCKNFIKEAKTKGMEEADIDLIINKIKGKNKKILELIKDIYLYYEKKLIDNQKQDFADMINKPIKEIKRISNFKYVIIDEYQDISSQRFKLIEKIIEKTNSKIVVVGDDWQSIFAFAGSEVKLFTNFEKNYIGTEILQITNTYRNSQELINVAGYFIMKNKNQIKKELKSTKNIKHPVIIYSVNKEKKSHMFKITVDKIISEYGINETILVLGRYNFDIKTVESDEYEIIDGKIICKKNPNIKIDFLTVHQSKGLGYSNVILLNAVAGKYGFPSNVKDDIISKYINKKEDSYRYAEERRLFYVALTRSQNKVYIITEKENESIFIKEIKKYPNVLYIRGLKPFKKKQSIV